jgi:hypothetical protein
MRKNLLLHFAESPSEDIIDSTEIEYDDQLSLSVIKGTKIPAVQILEAGTITFVKGGNGGSDSDMDDYKALLTLMGTRTHTRMQIEGSDSDRMEDKLTTLMATQTLTESAEALDNDK